MQKTPKTQAGGKEPAPAKRKKKKPRPEQVDAAAASIRKFWQTGRDSWEAVQATIATAAEGGKTVTGSAADEKLRYVHGKKMELLKQEAEQRGMNYDTLKKAWRASRLYTAEQIEELCDRVTKRKARFGATHLLRLLAVEDRDLRDDLTDRAIRGRWGAAALELAIRAAVGRRRQHAGNRPHIPDDEPALLNAVLALCEKWERFCTDAREDDVLPEDTLAAVVKAVAAVGEVKKAAARDLGRLAKAGGRAKKGEKK